MPFHHVAIATNDIDATHRFSTEVMDFHLVHAEAAEQLRTFVGIPPLGPPPGVMVYEAEKAG